MNDSYIEENCLKSHTTTMSIDAIKITLKQMENSVCRINCNDIGHGTGFFCKIILNDDWNSLSINVLMTNSHVLDKNDILPGKKINISLNNEELQILIDDFRKTYTNSLYDVTIIEIKQNDGIKKSSFLEIDDGIFDDYFYKNYKEKPIYLLHYPKGEEVSKSEGTIKSISVDNYNLEHYCDSSSGSSGGPIFNSYNYKVIGIHKGASKRGRNWNLGTFLKGPIEEFNKNINNNKNIIINKINEKSHIKEINIITKEEDEINKSENNILNEKIKNETRISENNDDEISIIYKINYNNDIRLFGDEFVENNINLCKMIINGEEKELCSILDLNNITINSNKLEIKLKGIQKITNISYMFSDCSSLISLPNISKLNTRNIINMNNLFENCESLSLLSDISKWDTTNVKNLSYMFQNCRSLSTIPDISDWNTENVTDMSFIFDNCTLLKFLPDISKWNVKNVVNMSHMFNSCFSLLKLPNISNWNTINVNDMSNMFSDCKSLSSFPDISKWDSRNVTDMKWMFSNLSILPDIGKWETKNVTNLKSIFYNCKCSIPDISKWNTENVTDMKSIFYSCKSIKDLPDISNWKTDKVIDMSHIFEECISLKSLPNISKWNTQNVQKMNHMFYNCKSLSSLPNLSSWNIQNVNNMSYMFFNCETLSKMPNFSNMNKSKSINMSHMYDGCKLLFFSDFEIL